MKMLLENGTEAWRERLVDLIDQAEAEAGIELDLENYDQLAENVKSEVASALFRCGVNYGWKYDVQDICKGGSDEDQKEFEAAFEAARADFLVWCRKLLAEQECA